MSMEVWSLAASVGTLLVIAATAIAAMIQLRHMRSSNQITALSKLEEIWDDPEFRAKRRRVTDGLDERLRDPAFRAELEKDTTTDSFAQDVVELTNFFEGMGIYAKHGLADPNVIFDFWSAIIVGSWRRLAPAIAIMRRTSGPMLCENFQYLAAIAQRFNEAHPNGSVPKGAALAPLEDVWLKDDHPV
ncbi:MAG: hypothetical protein JO194_10955 [Candidatus Eremiobacteraeota bacterium]|nr:hypothetical protein [Candidatus Eremiobacteraeota bacterium]